MSGSLIQRYTYGNFATYPVQPAEAAWELFRFSARHREVIQLAHEQIAVQRRAAGAIAQSNERSATLICREIEEQTRRLEEAVRQGAYAIVGAVDDLGRQVVGELGEIRWGLMQLRPKAGQMPGVLAPSRPTQATELLSQGVRNLNNDKLEQAEERFLRALDYDNTDYQILMNLRSVALRRGDAERAIGYLKDALTLPESLDKESKAEALWSLARIHYTQEAYAEAREVALLSLELLSKPRHILQLSAYCILAGRLQEGLTLLAEAIGQDRALFAVAASMPDFDAGKLPVLSLLGSLADAKLQALLAELQSLGPNLARLSELRSIQEAERSAVLALHQYLEGVAASPSYSRCCEALETAGGLRQGFHLLEQLNAARLSVAEAGTAKLQARKDLKKVLLHADGGQTFATLRGCLPGTMGAAIVFLVLWAFAAALSGGMPSPMKEVLCLGASAVLVLGGAAYFVIEWLADSRLAPVSAAKGAFLDASIKLTDAEGWYEAIEKEFSVWSQRMVTCGSSSDRPGTM